MNKEIVKNIGLGDFIEAVEQNKCPFCQKNIVIKDFKDPLSLREFEISGLCQECQDKTFGEDNGNIE